jgi:hypothetical protein
VSERLRQLADAEGGEMFMGWPDRWWADAHWRCAQGHVSTCVLRSEALGRDACLACRSPVALTFPEDRDGPLSQQAHAVRYTARSPDHKEST